MHVIGWRLCDLFGAAPAQPKRRHGGGEGGGCIISSVPHQRNQRDGMVAERAAVASSLRCRVAFGLAQVESDKVLQFDDAIDDITLQVRW